MHIEFKWLLTEHTREQVLALAHNGFNRLKKNLHQSLPVYNRAGAEDTWLLMKLKFWKKGENKNKIINLANGMQILLSPVLKREIIHNLLELTYSQSSLIRFDWWTSERHLGSVWMVDSYKNREWEWVFQLRGVEDMIYPIPYHKWLIQT